ncbi:thiamine phosphate synthase [Streptomyces sp. CBG30]|uniref:thiamine phosphate synthase n=1 Tax=Streptomyces sp. CBG30 TaxID=2838869 RepID=UPI0025532588|nr:thiamine phosphate synthase [Streptomyces sp. CBG30]
MPTPREQLSDARLYLCTDARKRQGDLPAFLDAVLAGGVDIVQLRDKGMEAAEELEHLAVFADACRRHGKLLAVNDRADVAHAIGADVLHLGQGDLPVPAARAIIGRERLIGRSTHAESEVDAAVAQEGVDYFCTGPCWPTPPSPAATPPASVQWRYAAAPGAAAPLVRDRRDRRGQSGRWCWRRAPAGSMVVRAITEANDPATATAELAKRVRAHRALSSAFATVLDGPVPRGEDVEKGKTRQ